MIKNRVICLHGFWGSPNDFDFLKNTIPNLEAVDLKTHNGKSLKQWTEYFQNEYFNHNQVSFIGYSQGGRLILEGLRNLSEKNEKKIKKIILLSTGIVFPSRAEEELQERKAIDLKWAQRFEVETTEKLWTDWNAQAVFAGSSKDKPKNELTKDDRNFLCHCLKEWSASAQQDTFSLVLRFKANIDLWVGDRDQKYLELSRKLVQTIPDLSLKVIKDSGHRLLKDQPSFISDCVLKLLN